MVSGRAQPAGFLQPRPREIIETRPNCARGLRSALNSEPDLDRCAQLIEVADRSANGMHEPYAEAIGCPTTWQDASCDACRVARPAGRGMVIVRPTLRAPHLGVQDIP